MLDPKRPRHRWGAPVPAHQRGYGPQFQRLRRAILRDEPNCRECASEGETTKATHCDHIRPLCLGGATIKSNLQPLCERHSRAKAGREGAHYRHHVKPIVDRKERDTVATNFLTAKHPERGQLWVAIDPEALCSAPAIAERRFASYLAPYESAEAARAALIEAGADPNTIAPEGPRKLGRGKAKA